MNTTSNGRFYEPGFILTLGKRPPLDRSSRRSVLAGDVIMACSDSTDHGFGSVALLYPDRIASDVETPIGDRGFVRIWDSTNTGMYEAESWLASPSDQTLELYRRSGLTWSELAALFDVDRRSLHLWARGAAPSTRNAARLRELLSLVRSVSIGSRKETRRRLLEDAPAGSSLFSKLLDARPTGRASASRPRPNPQVVAARQGPRATELLGALHGTAHRDQGRLVRAQPLRRRTK